VTVQEEVSALARAHAGEVLSLLPTEEGSSSDLTALAKCGRGTFFVKAMRNRPGGGRDSLLRERDVNPYVREVAPALLWCAEDQTWVVLGFEAVDGRPTNFVPGIQLVAAGHGPGSAEAWASRCPAWVQADPRAIDAFARTNVRMCEAFAARKPEQSRLAAMAVSAREWAAHRGLCDTHPPNHFPRRSAMTYAPETDRRWMARAIELSRSCPPVANRFNVGESALAKLAPGDPRLLSATIYSTLEPCSERASHPVPCARLIVDARIPRVVIAWREPSFLVADCQGVEQMTAAGIEVVELPEMAEAARAVNAHLDL
jgi:diaminohydroxyphosphoribosylaminopyrimidine deaminase/5-amino-6-(5-phosphoribosylamino)uracil reductase